MLNEGIPRDGVEKIMRKFISFEFAWVIYLFSPLFMYSPWFNWLPISIMRLFFVLTGIVFIYLLFTERIQVSTKQFSIVIIFSVFVLYSVLTLLWSPSREYGLIKAFHLSTVTLWGVVGTSLVVASSKDRFYRFMDLVAIYAFISTLAGFQSLTNWEVPFSGEAYLVPSLIISMGYIIIVHGIIWRFRPLYKQIVASIVAIVMIWALLSAGSRSALFGAMLASLLMGSFTISSNGTQVQIPNKLLKTCASGIILTPVAGILLTYMSPLRTLERTLFLLDDSQSLNMRLELYESTIPMIFQNPIFGNGLGSWPILYGYGDTGVYPHNLLLEVWAEIGLIGILILLTLFLYCTFCLSNQNKDPKIKHETALISSLLVVLLFRAALSHDLNGNRFLFAFLGLTAYQRSKSTDLVRFVSYARAVFREENRNAF